MYSHSESLARRSAAARVARCRCRCRCRCATAAVRSTPAPLRRLSSSSVHSHAPAITSRPQGEKQPTVDVSGPTMVLQGLPADLLASRIAAQLPPADRQASRLQNVQSARLPPTRQPVKWRRLTPAAACAALHRSCRLRLSHTCRDLRAASSTGWFPLVRVALRPDTDAEALGAWLRRIEGKSACV